MQGVVTKRILHLFYFLLIVAGNIKSILNELKKGDIYTLYVNLLK